MSFFPLNFTKCWFFVLIFFKEKAPYIEKAEKRKKDYEKVMHAYNKKQVLSLPKITNNVLYFAFFYSEWSDYSSNTELDLIHVI